jgi:putative transposase
MERAYEYRIYPNARQREQIESTFGACRWVWNLCLETSKAAWEVNRKNLSAYELMKFLTVWKRTVAPWLYDIDNTALQSSISNLWRAYQNFFRRVKRGERPGYPKFKSRRASTQSYTSRYNKGTSVIRGNKVMIPKLGLVKCKLSRIPEGRIVNATVKRTATGKYFVVLCCMDCPKPEIQTGKEAIIGVDAGLHDLMTRSDGVKAKNHRNLRRSERKLKRAQRSLSRKKKGSNNYKKQRKRLAKIHESIANKRKDAIHKATTDAVRESQAIAVEDLNVAGMEKNHHLAKSVADASMSEMIRQLEYKCQWYGRQFVKVDRWFPSTQVCGECGEMTGPKGSSELNVRKWTCPSCGATHDRDINAARNIARKGAEILGIPWDARE